MRNLTIDKSQRAGKRLKAMLFIDLFYKYILS